MRRVVDSEFEALLEKVLALPVEARAALAGCLLDSLDGSFGEGAAAAWEVEIARRTMDLDSGGVAPIPWSEARRSLLRP